MSMDNRKQPTDKFKEDFAKWSAAVTLQEAEKYQEALQVYHSMHETSARICYNMAVAYINVGDLSVALKYLTSAVEKDKGLAIAFFQRGTLYLERKDTQNAISDLETTRMLLRGNTFINYRPLGLFCHLHDFAILYNLAVAHLMEGDNEGFRMLMTEATHNADFFQRDQISDALMLFKKNRESEIQPVYITTDAVFFPPKHITKNLEPRKVSKRSKVVFTSDEKDNTPSFRGIQRVDELRRSVNQGLSDHQTSMKRKLFRKMKSTGDIKLPTSTQKIKTAREKSHSFICSNVFSATSLNSSSRGEQGKQKPFSGDFELQELKTSVKVISADRIDKHTVLKTESTETNSGTYKPSRSKLNYGIFDSVEISSQEMKNDNLTSSHLVECEQLMESKKVQENPTPSLKESVPRRKRFLKRKAESAGDIKVKSNSISRISRSAGDLDKSRRKSLLPLERGKKSRSSLTSLKQIVKSKVKTDSWRSAQEQGPPTVVTHGCKVAGDLLSMMLPVDRSEHSKDHELETGLETLDENNNAKRIVNHSSKSRYSLGAVFGDRSTVIKYALTEALDALTASITPTIDETEIMTNVCIGKKNLVKQNCQNVLGNTENDKMLRKSTKKRRAPDPPRSVIQTQLLKTGELITALVHQDFAQQTAGINLNENMKNRGTASVGSPNRKGIDEATATPPISQTSQRFNDKTVYVTSDFITGDSRLGRKNNHAQAKWKESEGVRIGDSKKVNLYESEHVVKITNLEVPHQNYRTETAIMDSESLMKVPAIVDEIKTPTYVNTEQWKKKTAKTSKGLHLSVRKTDAVQNPETNQDVEGTIRNEVIVPFDRVATSFSTAKVPPPSYPPPPLRPSYWKKLRNKQKKQKKPRTELNGLIGHAIVASGKMFGAVADVATSNHLYGSSVNSTKGSEVNKVNISGNLNFKTKSAHLEGQNTESFNAEDHDYINVGDTKTARLKGQDTEIFDAGDHDYINIGDTESALLERQGTESVDVGYHDYINVENQARKCVTNVNVKKSIETQNVNLCKSFKNLNLEDDKVLSQESTGFLCFPKRRTKEGMETIDGVLMTSCELLTAFVTSNQETEQAFNAFVQEHSGAKTRYNLGTSDEIEHDYVNVSRL